MSEAAWWVKAVCGRLDAKDSAPAFGTDPQQLEFAVKYCGQCPVWEECLNSAMAAERPRPTARFGVFGGLTPTQRRILEERGASACAKCRQRFYRSRTNQVTCTRCAKPRRSDPVPAGAPQGRRHGTKGGYEQHRRRREEPCEACRAAARAYWAGDRRRRGAA